MATDNLKITVAVRCLNEKHNIPSFMKGYDFADQIIVSDGGSTDGSIELLKTYPKVRLIHFTEGETLNGHFWNGDAGHMNFVLEKAKETDPDWLIFDDMDCHPNKFLRDDARVILAGCHNKQINAFRLYLWGDTQHFPHMSRNYHPDYRSMWGFKPKELEVHADTSVRHGTLLGLIPDHCGIDVPYCLLHKSWSPETIEKKIERYNAIGLPFNHPFEFAGSLEKLPDWASE